MPEDFRHLAFEFNEIVGVVQDAVCDCAVMRQERQERSVRNQTEKFVSHVHHLFVTQPGCIVGRMQRDFRGYC